MTRTPFVSRVTSYIAVDGAARAIDFYKAAFGAVESGARFTEPGGRVGHAEITIGDTAIFLSDEYPELGVRSPLRFDGRPVQFHLRVADTDATIARAVALGARVVRPATDQPYGERSGSIADPFGFHWMIATHIEQVSNDELQARVGESYRIT